MYVYDDFFFHHNTQLPAGDLGQYGNMVMKVMGRMKGKILIDASSPSCYFVRSTGISPITGGQNGTQSESGRGS
jgi:hypothetical protein